MMCDEIHRNGFLYSGKELERGKGLMLYDFHARQYDPQLGRFTSPDPLHDDYPGLDPYLYCAANPISLTDPTGMKIKVTGMDHYREYEMFIVEGKSFEVDVYKKQDEVVEDKFVNQVIGAMNKIGKSSFGENMITQLVNSDNVFTVSFGKESNFKQESMQRSYGMVSEMAGILGKNKIKGGTGGLIHWNHENNVLGLDEYSNPFCKPFIGLAHEMCHALDADNGTLYPKTPFHNDKFKYSPYYEGIYKPEWRAVYRENIIRSELGIPLRKFYDLEILPGAQYNGVGVPMLDHNNKPIDYPRLRN